MPREPNQDNLNWLRAMNDSIGWLMGKAVASKDFLGQADLTIKHVRLETWYAKEHYRG